MENCLIYSYKKEKNIQRRRVRRNNKQNSGLTAIFPYLIRLDFVQHLVWSHHLIDIAVEYMVTFGTNFSSGQQIILFVCLIVGISLLMALARRSINLRATKQLFFVFRYSFCFLSSLILGCLDCLSKRLKVLFFSFSQKPFF